MVASGKVLAGLLFLLMAALALPPVTAFITKQTRISLSVGVRAIITIVLIVLAGAALGPARIGESPIAAATPTAPTDQGGATAPATQIAPQVLLAISGSGIKGTEKFTTQGNDWDLKYSYDCSGFGQQGNFAVEVKGGDNSFTGLPGPNELGMRGSDVDHFHQGGTFYLEINSECAWRIEVDG